MAPAVVVTYELHPPSDALSDGLIPTKTHEFAVQPLGGDAVTGQAYYEALRKAILQAKATIGEELTAWRDAVGTREQTKESRFPKKNEESDEEEEEDADK